MHTAFGSGSAYLALLVAALCSACAASDEATRPGHRVQAVGTSIVPGRLAIYYGWPSLVKENPGDPTGLDRAKAIFAKYDIVVLGDGLQDSAHGDHVNTASIISHLKGAGKEIYGYIAIGDENTRLPAPLSMVEIKARVDAWAAMSVSGIFLDEAGYDFGCERARQNEAVNYVHGKGLKVFINAWRPGDVLGSEIDAQNPGGTAPVLNAGDLYLLESFQVKVGAYVSPSDESVGRANTLVQYRQALGTSAPRVATVTTGCTAAGCDQFDQNKLKYAWWSTVLYGFDHMGWGEGAFSASGPMANLLPDRQRPAPGDLGTFTAAVVPGNPVYTRATTTGSIEIDLQARAGTSMGPDLIGDPDLPSGLRYWSDATCTLSPGGPDDPAPIPGSAYLKVRSCDTDSPGSSNFGGVYWVKSGLPAQMQAGRKYRLSYWVKSLSGNFPLYVSYRLEGGPADSGLSHGVTTGAGVWMRVQSTAVVNAPGDTIKVWSQRASREFLIDNMTLVQVPDDTPVGVTVSAIPPPMGMDLIRDPDLPSGLRYWSDGTCTLDPVPGGPDPAPSYSLSGADYLKVRSCDTDLPGSYNFGGVYWVNSSLLAQMQAGRKYRLSYWVKSLSGNFPLYVSYRLEGGPADSGLSHGVTVADRWMNVQSTGVVNAPGDTIKVWSQKSSLEIPIVFLIDNLTLVEVPADTPSGVTVN